MNVLIAQMLHINDIEWAWQAHCKNLIDFFFSGKESYHLSGMWFRLERFVVCNKTTVDLYFSCYGWKGGWPNWMKSSCFVPLGIYVCMLPVLRIQFQMLCYCWLKQRKENSCIHFTDKAIHRLWRVGYRWSLVERWLLIYLPTTISLDLFLSTWEFWAFLSWFFQLILLQL